MLIFTFFIVLVCFLYSLYVSKNQLKVFNPILIFSTVVFISFVIYLLFFTREHVLSNRTLLLLAFTSIFFVFGSFLYTIIDENKSITKNLLSRNSLLFREQCNDRVLVVFMAIGLIGVVFGIIYSLKLGNIQFYEGGNFFQNLRENFVRMDNPLIIKYSKYFLTISTCTVFYQFLYYKKYSKRLVFVLIFFTFIQSFLQLSRADVFIMLLPLATIYISYLVDNHSNINKKHILVTGVICVLVLAAITFTIGIISLRTASMNIFDKNFFLYEYIARPLITFDQYVVQFPGISKGFMVFEPITKVLNLLNVPIEFSVVSLPIGTFNVYSALGAPYMDFGFLGTLATYAVTGFLSNLIYSLSLKRNGVWTIFYSTVVYALLMIFFVWQFTIITYIYFILMLFLLFFNYDIIRFNWKKNPILGNLFKNDRKR